LKVIVSVFWCLGRWLAALRRPGAHQRYADTWPTANPAPNGRYWPILLKKSPVERLRKSA